MSGLPDIVKIAFQRAVYTDDVYDVNITTSQHFCITLFTSGVLSSSATNSLPHNDSSVSCAVMVTTAHCSDSCNVDQFALDVIYISNISGYFVKKNIFNQSSQQSYAASMVEALL
jgi:hypothetical protein